MLILYHNKDCDSTGNVSTTVAGTFPVLGTKHGKVFRLPDASKAVCSLRVTAFRCAQSVVTLPGVEPGLQP